MVSENGFCEYNLGYKMLENPDLEELRQSSTKSYFKDLVSYNKGKYIFETFAHNARRDQSLPPFRNARHLRPRWLPLAGPFIYR